MTYIPDVVTQGELGKKANASTVGGIRTALEAPQRDIERLEGEMAEAKTAIAETKEAL